MGVAPRSGEPQPPTSTMGGGVTKAELGVFHGTFRIFGPKRKRYPSKWQDLSHFTMVFAKGPQKFGRTFCIIRHFR